jgi:hypothetical protein
MRYKRVDIYIAGINEQSLALLERDKILRNLSALLSYKLPN